MNIIDRIDGSLITSRVPRIPVSHYPSTCSVVSGGRKYGSCLRQLYWKWTGETETNPLEVSSIWKMELGNSGHLAIINLMKKAGFDFESEVAGKVNVEGLKYPISFRLDNVIKSKTNKVGLEVKTTFMGSTNSVRDSGPKVEHLMQVMCYMKFAELNEFVLLYVDRGSGYRMQFFLTLKDEKYYCDGKEIPFTIKDILERWIELEKALEEKKLPKRDYKVWLREDGTVQERKVIKKVINKSDWQCLYCPFQNKCWSTFDARDDCYTLGVGNPIPEWKPIGDIDEP